VAIKRLGEGGDVREHAIYVQDEVIIAISSTSDRLDASHACREQLRATKSALMSVLLTGEVRVTPDGSAA